MSRVDFASVLAGGNRADIPIYPLDVFALTDAGSDEIRGGVTRLPAEALTLMVLLDGKAAVGDIEQKLPEVTAETVRDVLRSLIGAGLVRAATIAETDGLDFSAYFEGESAPPSPSAGATASAKREAERGESQLVRTGYYVSIARRALKPRSPANGAHWCAFVVEDDPDISTLVSRLLRSEGFEVEVAATRAEVVARLRRPPMPDVMVLDISLPDANGFDILQRLKSHPKLKAAPVIMLTADARRESVVRGLAGGADGYITKPFERAMLRDGVRAVLGIGAA